MVGGGETQPTFCAAIYDPNGSLRGTAIVIDSRHAITAAHVLSNPGPLTQVEVENSRLERCSATRVLADDCGVVEEDVHHDIALLHLDVPQRGAAAAIMTGYNDDLSARLKGSRVRAVGYPKDGGGCCLTMDLGIVKSTETQQGRGLLRLQVDGGVGQGYSGGPIVLDERRDVVVGMSAMAGRGYPQTEALGSDLLLRFLNQYAASGVRVKCLDAAEVLSRLKASEAGSRGASEQSSDIDQANANARQPSGHVISTGSIKAGRDVIIGSEVRRGDSGGKN